MPGSGQLIRVPESEKGCLCRRGRPSLFFVCPEQDEGAHPVVAKFLNPQRVAIIGYEADAIEPFAARSKLIAVGVPNDEIRLNAFPLVFGGRSIYGSLTGTPIDSEDTLA